ncbi:MAG: PH domain-containing protein [Eubacterium sp.]|nr:PH domain-containing protein [Eubacterium sp.]
MYQEKKRSLLFGLPLSFTTYRIEEEKVNIRKGLLRTVEDDTLMYRIQDVKLVTGFLERIFRLGTVVCYSSDVTDPMLELKHIRRAREIKDYILSTSESERRKVRTLHTLDLDTDASEFADASDDIE